MPLDYRYAIIIDIGDTRGGTRRMLFNRAFLAAFLEVFGLQGQGSTGDSTLQL